MRIAICDNESIAIDALQQKISRVSKINYIQRFTSIQQFWSVLEDGETFHIVFMDIDWEQSNDGIDFAARLYELRPNTQVIYVTGYNDRFSQQKMCIRDRSCSPDSRLRPASSASAWTDTQCRRNRSAHLSGGIRGA